MGAGRGGAGSWNKVPSALFEPDWSPAVVMQISGLADWEQKRRERNIRTATLREITMTGSFR
jgi:hypothetical protein